MGAPHLNDTNTNTLNLFIGSVLHATHKCVGAEVTEHDGVEDLLVMMLSYVGLRLTSPTFKITLAMMYMTVTT